MTAKHIVVLEQGVRGLVLNPSRKDYAEGGTEHSVPFKPVLKAAKNTGIENYASRLKAGARVGMRGNNKVLAPSVRSIIKNGAAKPGTESNNVATPSTNGSKDPRFVKGTPEAKAHMKAIREKGKAQENNTKLVITKEDASSNNGEQALRSAIKTALDNGDYTTVEILVNKLHS